MRSSFTVSCSSFLLGADVQQTYPGLLYPHGLFHEYAAENCELLKHFGSALQVCAAVNNSVSSSAKTGHEGYQCGPLDALYPLADHGSADNYRGGASGADECVRIAVRQVVQRLAHGSPGILLDNRLGCVLGGDDAIRRNKLDVAVGDIQFLHALHEKLLIAGYRDVDTEFIHGKSRALEYFVRGIVAAKSIYNDFHNYVSSLSERALSRSESALCASAA